MAETAARAGERPTRVCCYCQVLIERGSELVSHGICPACEEQLATREGYVLQRCDDHRLLALGDGWHVDPDLARLFGTREAARDYLRGKPEVTQDLHLRVVRARRSVVLRRRSTESAGGPPASTRHGGAGETPALPVKGAAA